MRNAEPDGTGTPRPADDAGHLYASAVARSPRRSRLLAGAAGLLGLLGAGGILLHQAGDGPAGSTGTTAQAPLSSAAPPAAGSATTAPASPTPSATTTAPATPAPGPARVPGATTRPPASVAERAAALRSANAKAGTTVRRPLPPPAGAVADVAAQAQVTVVQKGSVASGKTMRVVSARQDLTGYRELGWVTPEREQVGDGVECTQRIQLSPDAPAKVRPTLLLCWRTSAARSAYTVAVDFKGKPSVQESIAEIDKAWSKLS